MGRMPTSFGRGRRRGQVIVERLPDDTPSYRVDACRAGAALHRSRQSVRCFTQRLHCGSGA